MAQTSLKSMKKLLGGGMGWRETSQINEKTKIGPLIMRRNIF